LKIQYGTSLAYPLYSIGSHVSAVPNHQTLRETPLSARANTAYFGTFGYELNPLNLKDEERTRISEQVSFYKQHRSLIREGHFYRLLSPFEGNETAWLTVNEEKTEALVGWYKILAMANPPKQQTLKLTGLNPSAMYQVSGSSRYYYGDELMQSGLQLPIEFNGVNGKSAERGGDFQSCVFHIVAVE
jgi:alpha-galactosidase